MKNDQFRIISCAVIGCALASLLLAQGRPVPPVPGVSASVSGTVSQFNFDPEGEVDGFLLGNTLVHLPPGAAPRYAAWLHPGDSVRVDGFRQTAPTGFQQIEAQSIEDRTSGKSLTMPQPGPPAPYSGGGRIAQLNYAPDGAVNGFLLDNGTLAKIPPFSANNPTSIRAGARVSYSGYAHRTMSDRTVVDLQTLTVDGQLFTLAEAGPGGPPPPPPPPPVR